MVWSFKKLCAASSSSSPLSNQMDPVVSLTCRSIFPPSPTETQLKCSPPHLYKYDSWLRILGSDKGSPELFPPPHCSQTRLKNDQKTTPTSDPVYLSEKPLLHIRVAKRHSSYTDNKLSLIFDPKKPVICNWYILATNPINPGQSKSFLFGLLHSSSNLISS